MDFKNRGEVVKVAIELVNLLSSEEKKKIFSALIDSETIPVSIFNSQLSGLEAIAYYLSNIKKKKVSEISSLLNRKKSTLYNTINKAKSKLKKQLSTDCSVFIPLSIFTERKYSVLESLVSYLKSNKKMTFAEIARLIGKSSSTVRTVYYRYEEKCR